MPQDDLAVQNEFDTSSEQSELDALNAELEQARANIEGNFSEYFAQNATAELDELYFEDKKAFADEFQKMQNVYFEEQIGIKQARAGELQNSIAQKQQFGVIDSAMKSFQAAHPDVNVDELFRFMSEDLSPKKVAELENLPPEQFFEELYALYQQTMSGESGGEAKKEKLPQQLRGVPSNNTQSGAASELPTQRL